LETRELNDHDLAQLLTLYTQLHDNDFPTIDSRLKDIWCGILSDTNHHIIGSFVDEKLVSSCVIIIIPNLTNNQRPYALIENVITDMSHRRKGYAASVLNHAKQIAIAENCYKIMLMTGSKSESVFNLYEKSGYNRNNKTAFIQWL